MVERDEQVGFLFADIARFRGVMYDQMVAQYNLTLAQAHVLNCLYQEDGVSQKTIADRLAIGTVTVSGLVDRLEAKDMVRRAPDAKDRRAKKIWLTDGAHDVRSNLLTCLTALNDIAFSGFSAEEIKTLTQLMKRTNDNLKTRLEDRV